MPEFTHADRCMIHAEQSLWTVHTILSELECGGAWWERIKAVQKEVKDIAAELTTYNDDFEEGE